MVLPHPILSSYTSEYQPVSSHVQLLSSQQANCLSGITAHLSLHPLPPPTCSLPWRDTFVLTSVIKHPGPLSHRVLHLLSFPFRHSALLSGRLSLSLPPLPVLDWSAPTRPSDVASNVTFSKKPRLFPDPSDMMCHLVHSHGTLLFCEALTRDQVGMC